MTDQVLLRSLLGVPQLLTPNEKTVFRRMLEDLQEGTTVSLSKKQKLWVEGRYNDLDLKKYYETKPVPDKVWTREAPPTEFEWQKNLPLKPPGRK